MDNIVICGGGIIGASTLYHLTQKGVKPTIIERNQIACGASGKAGGFLARNWCDKSTAVGPLARKSFDMHGELAVKLGVDCGYRRLDTLGVEVNMKKNKPVPQTNVPNWIDKNVEKTSVLGTSSNTAQVHPEKITNALVNAAKEGGASVVIGAVEGIEWDTSGEIPRVTGVHVNTEGTKKVIPAKVVVITMGPWSKWLLSWLPMDKLKSSKKKEMNIEYDYERMLDISAVRAHSIVMHPQVPVTAHALFLSYTDSHGGFSDPEVYPRPDGEVYMCGEAKACTIPIDPADVKPDEEAKEKLHGMASAFSSQLGETQVDKLQACCLPCSHDDRPLIGAIPGVAGLYIATGHSCWGILNAPATGAGLAELLVDGHSSIVDISPFDPARFTL